MPWPDAWPPRGVESTAGFVVGGWIAIGLAAVAGPTAWFTRGPAFGVGIAVVLVAVGLALLSTPAARSPGRSAPEMVNAVAISEPGARPDDSWVHLVRARTPPTLLAAAVLVLAAGFVGGAASAVAAASLGVGTSGSGERAGGALAGFVVGVVLLAGFGIVLAASGVQLLIARRRLSTFSARGVGLALGATHLTVFRAGDVTQIRWDDIREVAAVLGEASVSGRVVAQTPRIDIRARHRTVPLAAEAFAVDPLVVYTALVTFAASRQARALLGSGAGGRLLCDWAGAARAAR